MNYKQLCKELGLEEKKSGKARMNQISNIRKEYLIETTGVKKATQSKIIRPLTDDEKEFMISKETYNYLMQGILSSVLEKSGNVEMSTMELLILFGFVKEDFKVTRNNIKKVNFAEIYEMNDIEVNELDTFISGTYDRLKKTMLEQLNDMQDKACIHMDKVYYLCKYTPEGFVQKKADAKDIERVILPASRYALEKLGVDKYSELGNKKFIFYKHVKAWISKNSNDYDFFYLKRSIIVNKQGLKMLQDNAKNLINEKTMNRLKRSMAGLETNDLLIDALINLNSEYPYNIKNDIDEYLEWNGQYYR